MLLLRPAEALLLQGGSHAPCSGRQARSSRSTRTEPEHPDTAAARQ